MSDPEDQNGTPNEPLEKAVHDLDAAEHRLDDAREEIARAEHDVDKALEEVKEAEHADRFFFFVDNVRFETDQHFLTGAQIKAKVPDWPAGYGLMLEGHGHEPDRLISDDEWVDLAEHAPRRFTRVPPATFGA
jgi:hypothetical protein